MKEHLDCLIVGAGLSGVGAAWYVQDKCPWASYAVFEGRDAMGGTWDLFRYPGVRSDSDMYTLGYSFRPWPGAKTIADGPSILQYIKDTAAEYGIDEKIRFNHKVVAANWSTDAGVWEVTAERSDTGERIELTCSFLFACSGYYRYDHGYQPDFEGLEDYLGTVIHPQFWPTDLDYTGKRVVVIGSGATAITLVPSMADQAGHVTMLQRSPTYIVSMPGSAPIAPFLRKVLPDTWAGAIMRWTLALGTQGSYFLSKWRPNLVKKVLRRGLERQLPKGYDIDTHFTPRYNPWDERMCVVPNGDLFKAIKSGTVDVVTDHIDRFTEKGIRLQSGRELEADIVVTATGLELLFFGGIDATVDGEPIDVPNRMMYKGMMLEGVPNAALAIGYTNASWTLKCDLTCDYVTRLMNRMHETGLRQCMPVNQGTAVDPGPLLGLNSGYITRAADRFPKQGASYPWRVKMSYLNDYRALKLSGIDDGAMEFSNPRPNPNEKELVDA